MKIVDSVVELRPDGSYILVVPESIPEGMLEKEMAGMNIDTNLLVIRADGVKIITLTKG